MKFLKLILKRLKPLIVLFFDEFSSILNPKIYNIESWQGVQNQVQIYSKDNVLVRNGTLDIMVSAEKDGSFLSGRVNTIGKLEINCGTRIVFKAKLPVVHGMWPALWLYYPHGDKYGEIDIMELVDEDPNKIWASVHSGPSEDSLTSVTSSYTFSNGTFADNYHIFQLDWKRDLLEFYVDGKRFWNVTPETFKHKTTGEKGNWIFNDIEMAIIMNVAVGGNWPQFDPHDSTYPQHMLIDYIKIYKL